MSVLVVLITVDPISAVPGSPVPNGAAQQDLKLVTDYFTELNTAGMGSISEICDAENPFTPRGCVAQAWSVAEVLRSWAKTAPPADSGVAPP